MSSETKERDGGAAGIGTFVATRHKEPYPAIDPAKVTFPDPFVVCIVGASRGIGACIAQAYARAGASGLILASRRVSGLEDTAAKCKEIKPSVRIEVVACDISSSVAVAALAAKIDASFDRLDVVVVNSGYSGPIVKEVTNDDPETVRKVTETNYLGTYYAAHHLIPLLLATAPAPATATADGVGRKCTKAFLVVGSTAAALVRGEIANTQYCISKLAQLRLIELVSEQYGERGLLAVAVHPGAVRSEMAEETAPREVLAWLTDQPALCGAFMVWLTKPALEGEGLEWLGGRHLEARWDVGELVQRKDDVVKGDLLKLRIAL